MREIPDVLMFTDGTMVNTPGDWRRRREEIKEILQENEYGKMPPPPDTLKWEMIEERTGYCGGKAVLRRILITVGVRGKEADFPFCEVIPAGLKKPMGFLHINFRNDVPDEYMPTEEIVDGGFAVCSFGYQDVTADNGDFTDGIASLFFEGQQRAEDDPGKIALWAWAAMRVMDVICEQGEIDRSRVAVVGHSRLGKTALLASAMDERFALAISNDSGCSGAAVTRGKVGERVKHITDSFPFWFCPRYRRFSGREEEMPFEQHWLTALTAPRPLYVASASQDEWADPEAELLCCRLTSPVYELLGRKGFEEGGRIGYHRREGGHWLSRYDWQKFMEFRKRNENA